jgi:hypothetical protein
VKLSLKVWAKHRRKEKRKCKAHFGINTGKVREKDGAFQNACLLCGKVYYE